MLDKHSTSHTITAVESTTKTDHIVNTSSTTTLLSVNKSLSKSFDFNKSERTHTISVHAAVGTLLEPKSDDSGFFKRLLNRSTKKKKGTDETDEMHTESKLDQHNVQIVPKPELPKLIVETKPYESPSISCSPLNTYLPLDLSESKPKPSLPKTDKPRSGPAARQRVLPQEISISPKPDLSILSNNDQMAAAAAPITEPSVTEKLPPKSPKKSPSAHDTAAVKTFGYSPKPINKIVFSGLVTASESKTEEDDLPPPIPSSPYECRYIKAHHYRSDERLIPKLKQRNFGEDTFHSLSPPKVYPPDEWTNRATSKFSGILSKIDSKTDVTAQSPRRKAVEKSKSFRVYTENFADKQMLSNVNNMPSLPDLSLDRKIDKPQFLSVKPDLGRSFREITRSTDSKFEINDNNLMRPRDDDHSRSSVALAHRKNIIVETSKSPTSLTTGLQNITQIEDNIDKIMKSSFVTVLKKSSTSDLMEIKSKSNVSITSINSMADEFCVGAGLDVWNIDKDSDTSTSNSPETSPGRKFATEPTPSSPEIVRVPEFLKIQLNRTDPTVVRPKSHIVLTRNQRDTDETVSNQKPLRRFSSESLEMSDEPKSAALPPLSSSSSSSPPLCKFNKCDSASLTKLTESVSSIAPKSPTKASFSPTLMASSMSDIRKTATAPGRNSSGPVEPHQRGVIIERRKSVSDEKLKFERKIEEAKVTERIKRPLTFAALDDAKLMQNIRKASIDDENTGVVLRKKSFSQSNSINKTSTSGGGGGNKEDTPELMKVFARRSLKLKDSDDFHLYDTQADKIIKTKSLNLDSDKENQSSSEEKLDKLNTKAEAAIVQAKVAANNNNNNINNGGISNALKPKENDEKVQRKENEAAKIEFRRNCIVTPKPIFVGPNKLAANYRNSTTASFVDAHKMYTATVTSSTTGPTNLLSESNNNSTGTVINGNGNNNNNNSNVRHTINGGTTAPHAGVAAPVNGECSNKLNNSDESEFKGILQRRAEWEKRAKAALK